MTSSCDGPDDLSVRCRVRRSALAVNPEFEQEQEMECSLRNWRGRSSGGVGVGGTVQFPLNWDGTTTSHHHHHHHHDQHHGPHVDGDSGEPSLVLRSVPCPLGGSHRRDSFALLPGAAAAADARRAAEVSVGIARRFHSFGSYHRADSDASADDRRDVDSSLDASAVSSHLPPRRRRCRRDRPPAAAAAVLPESYDVPLSDIVHVDLTGRHTYRHRGGDDDDHRGRRSSSSSSTSRISLTTLSNGYFELSFHSHNSRDVAAAFLQSALPQERVRTGEPRPRWTSPSARRASRRSSSFSSAARGVSTFDADRFTDAAMYDWVRDESVADKLRRRAHALSARLGEITFTLTDCVCGARPPVARPRAAPDPPLSYEQLLTKLSEGEMKVQCAHDDVDRTTIA